METSLNMLSRIFGTYKFVFGGCGILLLILFIVGILGYKKIKSLSEELESCKSSMTN